MTFESLLEAVKRIGDGGGSVGLVVCNRTEHRSVVNLLGQVFNEQLSVTEEMLPEHPDDTVLLVRDGKVVDAAPLAELMNCLLLVNSDRFRTGTFGLDDHELPSVLRGTSDTALTLRGYPASNKEKLLWIAVSRDMEARALRENSGRLDAGFQNLVRIDDEFGTQEVYERLADSNVETHVYGTAGRDWINRIADDTDLRIHIRDTEEIANSWFVVHTSRSGRQGAFVSWEIEENVWRGAWTYDDDLVESIQRHIVKSMASDDPATTPGRSRSPDGRVEEEIESSGTAE